MFFKPTFPLPFLLLSLLAFPRLQAQEIALLKYSGGGDWYSNPTALKNLIAFSNKNVKTTIRPRPETVVPSSPELFSYPFVHMTGHGNVVFSDADIRNLRDYLDGGGFLHIDDNYGMDEFARREIARIYPDAKLVEIPATHAIFQKPFLFSGGIPKIHEHDAGRPQAFGIFQSGRLVLIYTFETDLGDGWEDPDVHNDPPEVREKALRMGANILYYAFNN